MVLLLIIYNNPLQVTRLRTTGSNFNFQSSHWRREATEVGRLVSGTTVESIAHFISKAKPSIPEGIAVIPGENVHMCNYFNTVLARRSQVSLDVISFMTNAVVSVKIL